MLNNWSPHHSIHEHAFTTHNNHNQVYETINCEFAHGLHQAELWTNEQKIYLHQFKIEQKKTILRSEEWREHKNHLELIISRVKKAENAYKKTKQSCKTQKREINEALSTQSKYTTCRERGWRDSKHMKTRNLKANTYQSELFYSKKK